MKKLYHRNVVSLYEVLDDPDEDSLYMVMEMCQKGVVMKVGLGERADPYDEERCRMWFRDMVLGMEYREWNALEQSRMSSDYFQYMLKEFCTVTSNRTIAS
jgi:serine/threonine protein kinase